MHNEVRNAFRVLCSSRNGVQEYAQWRASNYQAQFWPLMDSANLHVENLLEEVLGAIYQTVRMISE
jgi:hypothetical protein